jgi:hypothetical protein
MQIFEINIEKHKAYDMNYGRKKIIAQAAQLNIEAFVFLQSLKFVGHTFAQWTLFRPDIFSMDNL